MWSRMPRPATGRWQTGHGRGSATGRPSTWRSCRPGSSGPSRTPASADGAKAVRLRRRNPTGRGVDRPPAGSRARCTSPAGNRHPETDEVAAGLCRLLPVWCSVALVVDRRQTRKDIATGRAPKNRWPEANSLHWPATSAGVRSNGFQQSPVVTDALYAKW